MVSAFSLMTYNVHGAIDRDHRRNCDRIVKVIKEIDPDILMMQEVNLGWYGLGQKEASLFETIEGSLSYYGIKGITMYRARSGYGNAIFLRNRPENIRRHDISFAGREPRGVIDCVHRIAERPVRLLNTHLGLKKKERVQQLGTLSQLLKQDGELPTLLAGDFNEWRSASKRLSEINKEMTVIPTQRTFPAFCPLFALDRIFYTGRVTFKELILTNSPLLRIASDHRPLVARFHLI